MPAAVLKSALELLEVGRIASRPVPRSALKPTVQIRWREPAQEVAGVAARRQPDADAVPPAPA